MRPSAAGFHPTNHALSRAQQRGVSVRIINAIVAFADIRPWVGSGCRSLMISRRRLAHLPDGILSAAERERAAGVAVVLDASNGSVITVIHTAGRRAARYRRQFRSRRSVGINSLTSPWSSQAAA
jgi:hypothetical protein